MSTSDYGRQLPRVLQRRFESLGAYVKAAAGEETEHPSRAGIELSKESLQFIQLVALVYVLDRFFRTGTEAARSAVGTFEGLGMQGFLVGSAVFTSESEATLRGERLASDLRKSIENTAYAEILNRATSLRDLVRRLVREMRRAQ